MKNLLRTLTTFIIIFSFTNCNNDDDSSSFNYSPIYTIGSSPMSYQFRSPYIKGWGDCIKDYLKAPEMAKNRGRAGSVAGDHPERGYDIDNFLVFEHRF